MSKGCTQQMPEVKTETDMYVSAFERIERETSESGPSWLLPMRKAAIARFDELGFPTTRDEEWGYTNVSPIARTSFDLNPNAAAVSADLIAPYLLGDDVCCRLVFVNGIYSDALSCVETLADGVTVESLAAALRVDRPQLSPHLARFTDYRDRAFTALNTALMRDGAFVHVSKGVLVERAIHLLFVSTDDGEPTASFPRNLIVADRSAQVTVVETHISLGSQANLCTAVTEIVAGENAAMDHYKVIHEDRSGDDGYHIGHVHLQQNSDSIVRAHVSTFGGAIVRNEVTAMLDGEGCQCTANGLTMIHGTQHVDNHLQIDHARPHCNSWEYYKSVLDDRAHSVFTGRINVHKDAQKTDAKQTNMNLLLSDESLADSKPQLEIFADDVKCTHGATIGQVDEEAIFYMRSRGMSNHAARSLLVAGFARESLDEIRVPALRQRLDDVVLSRLPDGDVFRGM
jgi:Fe-S cluster assembly protein SufD